MGVVATVVEAAVGWLVENILGNLLGGKLTLKEWASQVGLADDVEKLEEEVTNVQMVIGTVQGKEIKNRHLAKSVEKMKQLLYDAEDVLDELDYYRIQYQVEGDNANSAAAATAEAGSTASPSTSSSALQLISNVPSLLSHSVSAFTQKRKRSMEQMHDTVVEGNTNDGDVSRRIQYQVEGGYVDIATVAPPPEVASAASTRKKKRSMKGNTVDGDVSRRIQEIVRKLCKVRKDVTKVLQLEKLDSIERAIQSQSAPTSNPRLTTSYSGERKVYGRDADRDRIIQQLTSDASGDLTVLPIVGNGGVGKTTLAQYVYHDQAVKSHFELKMWVCVSNNFDEVRITREMLDCVSTERHEGIKNFDKLQGMLEEKTKSKGFLLVLDDMWEDKDKSRWDTLLAPLRCSQVKGCMILATTRAPSVANMIGTTSPIDLKGLKDEEFWLFFKACAFGDENYDGHLSLQSTGRKIAAQLKGYPLATKSVGILLSRNLTDEHWTRILQSDEWKSLEGNNDILPVLKLSYDHLPFHLQRCFSYCSLFPEDYKFAGEELVSIWISQGFVYCEHVSERLEDVGSRYLDDLVNLGFFEEVGEYDEWYSGRACDCYVMHDLMHDLAVKVSSSECLAIDGSKSIEIPPSIRHLSLITDAAYSRDEQDELVLNRSFQEEVLKVRPILKKLRTLMLIGNYDCDVFKAFQTLFHDEEMPNLRLLQIRTTTFDDLLSFLCNSLKPFHVRYLRVCCDYNNDIIMPQNLSKFYHLQVLHHYAPRRMTTLLPRDLVNLRHFIAHEELHAMIAGVGKMTSLQELRQFKIQTKSGFEIGQLRCMDELVSLRILQLENVGSKTEASESRLIAKKHIKELFLSWNAECNGEVAAEVLEGLQPHPNIRHLQITGYNGISSPTWLTSNLSLANLQSLRLDNCKAWRTLPSFEKLFALRKLKLINNYFATEVSIASSLEELTLCSMENLESFVSLDENQFILHLSKLCITTCPKLRKFPLLQCSSSEVEDKQWFPKLHDLTIEDCPQLMLSRPLPHVPTITRSWLSIEGVGSPPCNIVLECSPFGGHTMDIEGSVDLGFLDERILAFHNLRSLQILHIEGCPNLTSLPFRGFRELISLERLYI